MDREEFIKVFLGSMPNKENNFKVSLFEQSHLRGLPLREFFISIWVSY